MFRMRVIVVVVVSVWCYTKESSGNRVKLEGVCYAKESSAETELKKRMDDLEEHMSEYKERQWQLEQQNEEQQKQLYNVSERMSEYKERQWQLKQQNEEQQKQLYNLSVNTLAKFDVIKTEQQELSADYSNNINDLNEKYNHTVRQCLSGIIKGACAPCKSAIKKMKYADHVINFSPSFHKTPKVIQSQTVYDDILGTPIRRNITVTSLSHTQMTIRMSAWYDSRILNPVIEWMACA